jgi:hypothetical protein
MIEIGRTILSLDVFEKHFVCDLLRCKGGCCVEGDSGAPVTDEESQKIKEIYPVVKDSLPSKNVEAIENQGLFYIDQEGDLVTSLVDNRECVFSFRDEKGILKCAIEKAYREGKSDFIKPLSCHLFPIRVKEYKRFDAINYEELEICKPGRECGASQQVPLYRFLKEPLVRKYGAEWFAQVEIAAEHLQSRRKK